MKSLRPKKSLLIFYVIEAVVTIVLFLWLWSLAPLTGGLKINVQAGSAGTVTFVVLGVLAYFLGLQHGLDMDHLAAIDNTTRKLMQEKKPSTFAGFFFSAGHALVVFILALGLIVAAKYVTSIIPTVSVFGTLINVVFLYLIALLNIQIVIHLYRVFKKAERKKSSDNEINNMISEKGFINKYINKLLKIVDKQWYMFPIGFLFGLSFDTASQVALLAISVTLGGIVLNVPFYALMIFPLLFAVGLILTDSTDGFFMSLAYGWAFKSTLKKLWYNMTMTTVSVLVATIAATIELFALLSEQLQLQGSFWGLITALSGQYWSVLGLGIVGTFVITFIASFIVYKTKIKPKLDLPTDLKSLKDA